jgi:hypothetical protein
MHKTKEAKIIIKLHSETWFYIKEKYYKGNNKTVAKVEGCETTFPTCREKKKDQHFSCELPLVCNNHVNLMFTKHYKNSVLDVTFPMG